jgi:endonuclease/exonuclease/phosphatase family metal-dependent hydrolase
MLLFFLQLLATWFESIYRMSLIKLSMGGEMFGLLLILLPLLLLVLPQRSETRLLRIAIILVLITRALMPFLGAPALIVNCGLGLAAFLTLITIALGRQMNLGDLRAATVFAIVFSVALRAWGSSFDLSIAGLGAVIGWALLLIAAVLLLNKDASLPPAMTKRNAPAPPWPTTILASLGLFATLAFVYLALSSPAVVTAWSGSHYLLGTTLLVLSLAVAADTTRTPGRALLLAGNLLFVGATVIGILLHSVPFPASPEAGALVVRPGAWWTHLPFYLMFLLAPVTAFNIQILGATLARVEGGPRRLVLPVLLGMAFLFAIALLLTFSNVWGYVGALGAFMRGKFYLPFLIAGLGMVAGTLAARHLPPRRAISIRAPWAFALLAIVGVLVRSALPAPPETLPETLTVLTYNLQQGSEKEGDRNYHDQLELLRTIDADLIGLQESDTPRPSGGNVDVARFFAEGLGYHVYYGPSVISGTFGTALLSRFPIENPRTYFTYSSVDETGTAAVDVLIGDRRIGFFNSHPAGPPDTHHAHVDALIAAVAPYEEVIAVGDYNFRQDSPYYEKLSHVLRDTWAVLNPDATGPRHPELDPAAPSGAPIDMTRRIDHIFISNTFAVFEDWYLDPPASETDHPAHWSILRLQ